MTSRDSDTPTSEKQSSEKQTPANSARGGSTLLPWLVVCTLTCAAGLAGFSFDDSAASDDAPKKAGETISAGNLESVPEGAKRFDIFYLVNNMGYIDVCGCKNKKIRQGSLPRRASFLKQMRASGLNPLLVDGGNTLFGRQEKAAALRLQDFKQPLEKAKVIVESYNRMGYHAMTIGFYDLYFGLDKLRVLEEMADFPIVCANFVVEETGETVFPPHHEVEIDGVKFGILGLTMNTIQPHFLARRAKGTTVTPAIDAAKKYVPELAARNDVIIVLSHNSMDDNREIADNVPEIDFITDPSSEFGSEALWIDKEDLLEVRGPENDPVNIVRGDSQGARLVLLDGFLVKPSEKPGFIDRTSAKSVDLKEQNTFKQQRFPIEPHFLEDPDIQRLMDAFRKSTAFVDLEELPPFPNKDKYLTVDGCAPCHEKQTEFWKTTKHATAFASLEETGDQWRQDCISCHVLGYGQAFIAPQNADPYKNVQCESCHGLNPEHAKQPKAHRFGRVQEIACLTCHNKAQTHADFIFHKARPQVACPSGQ